MDELDLLARALPDARPPSPEVVERARARLSGPPPRKTRSWWMWAPLATAAVVVLVATLVANLAPAATTLVPPAGTPRINEELFQLADRVERLPAPGGAYWHRVELSGDWMDTGPYTMLVQGRREVWLPRDPGGPAHRMVWEQPAVRPASTEDERAWRAAGAPGRVRGVCEGCKPVRVADQPGGCEVSTRVDHEGRYPDTTVSDFTMADLAALPGEPGALMERLRAFHAVWVGRGFSQPFEQFLPVSSNLLAMPIGQASRAALLRLLAGSPSTRVIGPATDPLGRQGIAVDFGGDGGYLEDLPLDHWQILDPGTGAVLSAGFYAAETAQGATKGRLMSYRAYLSEGWTGAPEAAARSCPRSQDTQ